jgi:hypothetical protein
MARFDNAREAKEFLISRIADQAQRDGVPLSEIERKELYFSESGWTLPDIMEVNEAFERDYDQTSYEKKIKKLVREARIRARKEAPEEVKSWSDAIRILYKEDHYISVMLGHPTAPRHPFVDLIRAVGTGLVLSAIFGIALRYLESHVEILKTREGWVFWEWWIAAGFVSVNLLLWLIFGREKGSAVLDRVIDPPLMLLMRILEWSGIFSK